MENIIHEKDGFKATTFVRDNPRPSDIDEMVDSYGVTPSLNKTLGIYSADEIPLFLYEKGRILIAAKVNKEDAIKGETKAKIHATITQYNLDPSKLHAYMGPCLTFSHTVVDRPIIEDLMEKGYRAAAKRTDGVDFIDVPVLLLLELRSLSIPMENITIGNYDTYENPELFYSSLRGDEQANLTIASLL